MLGGLDGELEDLLDFDDLPDILGESEGDLLVLLWVFDEPGGEFDDLLDFDDFPEVPDFADDGDFADLLLVGVRAVFGLLGGFTHFNFIWSQYFFFFVHLSFTGSPSTHLKYTSVLVGWG